LAYDANIAQAQTGCAVETFAGGGVALAGDGGPALGAELYKPSDLAYAPDGSLYFVASGNRVVRRVRPDGVIERVAGTGTFGDSGDGGPALNSTFGRLHRIALGGDGSVFVYDQTALRIRRIRPDGVIEAFAGDGTLKFTGDGGPATAAAIGSVGQMDVGPDDSLYFAAPIHQRVRRVTPEGKIETVAGSGPAGFLNAASEGDGGPAKAAKLAFPVGVAVDSEGRLYIGEESSGKVRLVDETGTIQTLRNDIYPGGRMLVELGPGGELYFSIDRVYRVTEGGAFEQTPAFPPFEPLAGGRVVYATPLEIRILDAAGTSTVAAGIGRGGDYGAGQLAREAALLSPVAMTLGPDRSVFVSEGSVRWIRKIDPGGRISHLAGSGEAPVIGASLVAASPNGDVYFLEGRTLYAIGSGGQVRRISSPFGTCNFGCDGQHVSQAAFVGVSDMEFASDGTLYFAESSGSLLVRFVAPDGIVGSLPRNPEQASNAWRPVALAVDRKNRVVIGYESMSGTPPELWRWSAESGYERVHGPIGFLPRFRSLAVGSDGTIYMTEIGFNDVLALTPKGDLITIAGHRGFESLLPIDGPSDGPAKEARFWLPTELDVDADGALYILDSLNDRIRRIPDVDRCDRTPQPWIAEGGVLNAASYQRNALANGTIVSIFGAGLGSDRLVTAGEVFQGHFPTELGGVRVLIGGVPAPLIFVSAGQLSAVVPYAIDVGLGASVEVEYGGAVSRASGGEVALTAPGIFTADGSGAGQATALNQDFSINSAANPAAAGSVVVLYGTGAGQMTPTPDDGAVIGRDLPRPVLPVSATVNGQYADILYAGGAPGLVAGVLQVNLRLPTGISGVAQIVLTIGAQSSRPVTVSVAP
jgi:uncharacterized protein (TIGR03437 family)